jgi:hypothetical protein
MRRLSVWISVSLMALLSGVASSTVDEQSAELDRVLKPFPASHLLALQERDTDMRAFFVRHFPKDNPSLVRADFDGNGYPDYALLLRDDKTGATKLVVLLCAAGDQCKKVYELDEAAHAGAVYLRPVSIGSKVSQTDGIPGNTPPIKLGSTGIQINYFEKGKIVLYWNPKHQKIQEIQTSD